MILLLLVFFPIVNISDFNPSWYLRIDYADEGYMIGFDTSQYNHQKINFIFISEADILNYFFYSSPSERLLEAKEFDDPVIITYSSGNYPVGFTDPVN